MVRGVHILLIITVLRQALPGSVFDHFGTPDKKDKNKMLLYLRGLLKGPTTVKVTTKQTAVTLAPVSGKIEIWDGNNLPDRSDKSKMLAYLRGVKAPAIFNVYEDPQHRGLIQTLETNGKKQNTDLNQIPVELSNTAQKAAWDNPGTDTQELYLPPVYKEGDSDTCFWRGQQSGDRHKLVANDENSSTEPGKKKRKKKKKPEEIDDINERSNNKTEPKPDSGFENAGENVIAFFDCAKIKFWKSFNKLQQKICGMFSG